MRTGRDRQCGGKRRFDSFFDARMGMIELVGKRPEFNVYLCPHCDFWHFGHRPSPIFLVPDVDKFDMGPGAINEITVTRFL